VGIPVSLILIAVGAILTFAVNQDSSSAVDVDAVGWILMGVGLVSILLSLLFWQSWAGPGYWSSRRRTTYVDDGPPPTY
jgi:ABC-type transport system involved in cytochrome c biogenesis permease subunit